MYLAETLPQSVTQKAVVFPLIDILLFSCLLLFLVLVCVPDPGPPRPWAPQEFLAVLCHDPVGMLKPGVATCTGRFLDFIQSACRKCLLTPKTMISLAFLGRSLRSILHCF